METKFCKKCGQYKPITEFYKNNRGGCKKCIRVYQKKYYEDNYASEKVTDPEGFRTCSICRNLKPVSEFYRDRSNVSGYNHRCKKCGDALRETRRQKEKQAKAASKEVIPDGFKRCNKCRGMLPLTEFNLGKSGPSAGKYYPICRNCKKLYRQQNKEQIAQRQKEYVQRPEIKAKTKTRVQEWKKTNLKYRAEQKVYRVSYRKREYVKVKSKEHGANYRSRPESQESARKRTIEWRKANPERERHNVKLKQYRKKNAVGTHTYDQWLTLLTFFDCCPCCGKKRVLTRDHIIPLNKGGTNWITNIQPLCRSCNAAKQDHHTTDYRPDAARLWAASEMAKMTCIPFPSGI